MSNLSVRGNASGTGTVIVESPNTNTNRTITLPDATTTLVGTDAAQTLTNKTISGSTMNGGAITSGTAVASTSGTAIDFTGIPSWAKRVTVMFSGVSTSGTAAILVQLGTSGGFVTTGYTSTAHNSTNAPTNFTTGLGLNASSAAASLYFATMTLTNPTGNQWIESHQGGWSTGGGMFGGGGITLSGVLDRIRITTSNGTDTFDAGTVNVMWEG